MWELLKGCARQVRATFGGAYAWDFAAVMVMASAMGADADLTAELLPLVEPFVLRAMNGNGGEEP